MNHTDDCAVHSPTLRPCSCGLETRMRDEITALRERAERAERDAGGTGIYVASRASIPERSAMWRAYRADGVPIVSTWIDEAGEGETACYVDLWDRITSEISGSAALILYAEPNDFPLKGALIEVGIAIGMCKPIIACLPRVQLTGDTLRPVGSWIKHRLVARNDSITDAIFAALAAQSTGNKI